MRALPDRPELAEAVARLARELRPDGLLAPLPWDLARARTLARSRLHHCVQSDLLYRLGGVCLLPVAAGPSPADSSGVVMSWTTHQLLSLDRDRQSERRCALAALNRALADVLAAFGNRVRRFGEGARRS